MKSWINSDSFPGPLVETRAASSGGGGTSLTTTATLVNLPLGTTHVGLIVRNFAGGANVVKFATNQYLLLLRTDNALLSVTDSSAQGQQPSGTGVSFNALDTLANGGAFLIGSRLPIRGVQVTMSASVNAVVSVLSVEYWNGAWVPVAGFSDGTTVGGATLAQTGNVTWTVPTDQLKSFLNQTMGAPIVAANQQHQMVYADSPRYWMRWTVSAKLSATVKANTMLSFNRSTAYAESSSINNITQFRVNKEPDGISCLELLTDAGTANAIVNVYVASYAGGF